MLGSGGARGHAHIGVIRAIEERGARIHNIAGTSMGSVVGGIYAAGELDTYAEWAGALTRNDVFKLLDLSFSRKALFKGERIFEVLKDLVGDCKIEELERGFTAVATDIEAQNEVWLNRGSLFTAMKASTAVPGVFDPVEINGRILVDGGLVNPIPIAPTLNDSTDLTIAVNLNSLSDESKSSREADSERADDGNEDGYRQRITDFVAGLIGDDDSDQMSVDAAELLTRSIDVMQGGIARLKLAAYAPDKVVEISRNACSFFEFHRADEMADLGYRKTVDALDALGL